jgi:hypothetical protein
MNGAERFIPSSFGKDVKRGKIRANSGWTQPENGSTPGKLFSYSDLDLGFLDEAVHASLSTNRVPRRSASCPQIL